MHIVVLFSSCPSVAVSSHRFLRVVVLTISPSFSIRRPLHKLVSGKSTFSANFVSILKEAIAKIEDDDKCSHQQQSTLSPLESFSENCSRYTMLLNHTRIERMGPNQLNFDVL